MSNYPEGSYVKSSHGNYMKVLGQAGDVRFLSSLWAKGKEESKGCAYTKSVTDMEHVGYVEVSPEEATGRKEKWEPEMGEEYFSPDLGFTSSSFDVIVDKWDGGTTDRHNWRRSDASRPWKRHEHGERPCLMRSGGSNDMQKLPGVDVSEFLLSPDGRVIRMAETDAAGIRHELPKDMTERKEWWRDKWTGSTTVDFANWLLAEAVARRDREILERVEELKKKRYCDGHDGCNPETCCGHCCDINAFDEVIEFLNEKPL